MTKVITYNNIQLSFQADTSGIKSSKSELAQLTREVSSHRTNLEKYIRKLEVINQLEKKGGQSTQFLEDRVRAATKTYIEAETKLGKYGEALLTVTNLVPAMTQEIVDLALAHKKEVIAIAEANKAEEARLKIANAVRKFRKEAAKEAEETEKRIAEIEARKIAQLKQDAQGLREILRLEEMIRNIKLQQMPVAHREYLDRKKQIDDFRKAETDRAKARIALYKEEQAALGKTVDPARIRQFHIEAGQNVKRFVGLIREQEQLVNLGRQRVKTEQENAAKLAEEEKITKKLIADENGRNEAIKKRMGLYQQMPKFMSRERLQSAMASMGAGAKDVFSGASMGGLPGGMLFGMGKAALGGFAVTAGVISSLKAYSDLRNNLVQLEVQFGDVSVAAAKFAEIRRLAAASPLETRDLMQAATSLAQYGFTAEEIVPSLEKLAAISSGNAMRMEGLSRAFAQVRAAGRLTAQEVLQFVNSGFSPLAEISRVTGIEMSRLKKLMEEGKITFKDVKDSLASATEEGGRFYGQTEKQAEELSAKFNALKDSVRQLGEMFGGFLSPAAKESMNFLTFMFQTMTAGGRFTGRFFTEAAHEAEVFTDIQRELESAMHDIFAARNKLDFGPIAQDELNKFSDILEANKQFDNDIAQKELARNQKALEKVQGRIEKLDEIKKLEEDIAKATMSAADYAKRENKNRFELIKREALERAQLEIEADKLSRNAQSASAAAVDAAMKKAMDTIDKAKVELEKLPYQEAAQKIRENLEKLDLKIKPQEAVMKQAKEIADMIKAQALTMDEGARELARIMGENIKANEQQAKDLPRALQAGTVEAYQAMFGMQDVGKQQLAQQKRQVKIGEDANGLLRQLVNQKPVGVVP
jgi:tape measure domain-containing protein